jgi:hypothetical protein
LNPANYTFFRNIVIPVLVLAMTFFIFLYTSYLSDSFKYCWTLLLGIALARLIVYRRYVYLTFYKKPILITNENYIYDVATETKYYWTDIEEVLIDNAYLYLTLYDPASYLNKIGDPVKRYFINLNYDPGKKRSPYRIDLDWIDLNQDDLLEILDDHIPKETEPEKASAISDSVSYNFKWGRSFVWNLSWQLFFGFFIILNPAGHNRDNILVYIYLFLLITLVLPWLIKFFYFGIRKKLVLTVNGSFIFDHYENIKYYWDDVEEVIASGDYLHIKLYEPEKYLDKCQNPFRRFLKKKVYQLFKIKPSYGINLDIINIKKDEQKKFLDTLNAFSMTAEG